MLVRYRLEGFGCVAVKYVANIVFVVLYFSNGRGKAISGLRKANNLLYGSSFTTKSGEIPE